MESKISKIIVASGLAKMTIPLLQFARTWIPRNGANDGDPASAESQKIDDMTLNYIVDILTFWRFEYPLIVERTDFTYFSGHKKSDAFKATDLLFLV